MKIHFHGAIVTETGFIERGTLVVAAGRVERVCSSPTPADAGGVDVDTRGLLCPGFVDTHNHAAYAAFRRWMQPARYFASRFDWRGKTRCKVFVVPQPDPYYADQVAAPYKAIASDDATVAELMTYGQVRGVVGGATTMVVDADLDPDRPIGLPGFTRDPSDWPGRVWGVLDVGCVDAATLTRILADLRAPPDRTPHAKLLVHVGEGTDAFSRGEFLSLLAKDLLTEHTALIHAIGLLEADWRAIVDRRASVIWSPASNFRLYGRSVDVGLAFGLGVPLALAPDWTISGSSTMLDELGFVRARYRWISPERLLAMCTSVPADIIGMPELGRLKDGCFADLIAFGGQATSRRDAADLITGASVADLKLAVVGGAAVYGDPALVSEVPDLGIATEKITVPSPAGTLERALRLGPATTWSKLLANLAPKFAAQHLEVAPLWEQG